ncbi:hypothetical protein AZA_89242 [Nitrospirillum viridazoti Y2]|nr:hypothetical protein AZA_89242 [Nitrospirillum amazonense Y2]
MAVHGLYVPAIGDEAGLHVLGQGQVGGAVDGDAVVVPQDDQAIQAQVAGQRGGLMADTFLQAAVTGDDIGVVVHQGVAEAGVQVTLRQGHAHGGGDALAQRAGGHLDAAGHAVFRVAGGAGAQLAELLDLLQINVLIPREVEQRVDQHGAMAGRQHEAVAVGPIRALGIELQELGEQHGGDIGHAHGHAGMARLGRFHGVHGQDADGGGEILVGNAPDDISGCGLGRHGQRAFHQADALCSEGRKGAAVGASVPADSAGKAATGRAFPGDDPGPDAPDELRRRTAFFKGVVRAQSRREGRAAP